MGLTKLANKNVSLVCKEFPNGDLRAGVDRRVCQQSHSYADNTLILL